MSAAPISYGFSTATEVADYKAFATTAYQHLISSGYKSGLWCHSFPAITTVAVVNRVKEQLMSRGFGIVPSYASNSLEGSNDAFNCAGHTCIRFMPLPDAVLETPPADPFTSAEESTIPSFEGDVPEDTLWNAKFTANAVFHYVQNKLVAERTSVKEDPLSDSALLTLRIKEMLIDRSF